MGAIPRRLLLATRGSALAVWQAEHVSQLLRSVESGLEIELVRVKTSAESRLDVPISELGGKGVFVKEVQALVLAGRADLAVHSAKDLPAGTPPGLVLAAVPQRGDPRDALVGSTVAGLPEGGVVATGSARRRAQLAHARPDLRFQGLRGNMPTRLAKARDVDAIVVAAAALERLGLGDHITERLEPDAMLPQVAQGALAVECRPDDREIRDLLAAIEHAASRRAVDAERGFLSELGGDCSLPAAAYATVTGDQVVLRGLVASDDGAVLLSHELAGPTHEGPALGRAVARQLLDEQGGAKLLEQP